jgi:hypothetical protein
VEKTQTVETNEEKLVDEFFGEYLSTSACPTDYFPPDLAKRLREQGNLIADMQDGLDEKFPGWKDG